MVKFQKHPLSIKFKYLEITKLKRRLFINFFNCFPIISICLENFRYFYFTIGFDFTNKIWLSLGIWGKIRYDRLLQINLKVEIKKYRFDISLSILGIELYFNLGKLIENKNTSSSIRKSMQDILPHFLKPQKRQNKK